MSIYSAAFLNHADAGVDPSGPYAAPETGVTSPAMQAAQQGALPNMPRKDAPALPVLDGLLYNPRLLYAPCRSLPLLREKLLPYTGYNYQPRFYLAPNDFSVGIAAGATDRTQLRMVPGSVIVGLRFTALNAFAANQVSYLLEDANVQSSEGGGGLVDGQDRYLNCAALVPSGASGAPFCFLNQPYEVGGGVISVSLANLSTTATANCQLLLYVMEPVLTPVTPFGGSVLQPTQGQVKEFARVQQLNKHNHLQPRHGGRSIMHPRQGGHK